MSAADRQQWRLYLKACEQAGFPLRTVRTYLISEKGYDTTTVDAAIADYRALRHKRVAYAGMFLLLTGMFVWILLGVVTEPSTTGYAVSGGPPVVTVDVSRTVGVVSDTFYGVNTHGVWGSNNSRIDCNNDGAEDCMSDYAWHRTMLLNASTAYIRSDMALADIATGVNTFKTGLSNYGSMTTRKSTVAWAAQNNIKVLFTAYTMPSWLSDNQSYCASDHRNCPPSNYATWGQLVVNYLNAVGCTQYPGTCEVDVWNEPDLQMFWLPDIAATDPQRAALYNRLYNETYNAIKAWNPSIPVGGPGTSTLQDPGSKLVYRSFLGNLTGRSDFFTFHEYYFDTYDTGDYDGHLRTRIMPQLMADCAQYGFDCSRIVLGEYNTYNYTEQLYNPTGQGKQLALAYAYLLNSYPEEMSTVVYQWAEGTNYTNAASYPEHPRRMTMVAEPRLENTVYPPYTMMESFARYHGAGATVVNSSSTDSDIATVASTSGTETYLTVINRASTAQAVTVGITGMTASLLDDLASSAVFTVTSDTADLGMLPAGAVKHYRIIPAAPNVLPNTPAPGIRSADGSNNTGSDLECAATLSDNDSTTLNATVRWYRNGNLHSTAQYAQNFGNGSVATGVLDDGLLAVADLWSCRMQASDGLNTSGWGVSGSLLVLSLPVPPPQNGSNGSNSTNSSNSTLPPGNGTNQTNSTLPPSNATNGSNGSNASTPMSAPAFYSLTNNASSVTRRQGTVQWNAAVFDDAGIGSVSFSADGGSSWVSASVGNGSNSTNVSASATATVVDPGGSVVCGQFSARSAANQTNVSDQSCFFVANTPPVLQSVEIVSVSNTTADDLGCSVVTTDADGEASDTTVTWYLHGIGVQTAQGTAASGAELEFTLPRSFLTVGEQWTCGAVSTDGADSSEVLSSTSITITASAGNGSNQTNSTNNTNSTQPPGNTTNSSNTTGSGSSGGSAGSSGGSSGGNGGGGGALTRKPTAHGNGGNSGKGGNAATAAAGPKLEITTTKDSGPAQNAGGEAISASEEQLATPVASPAHEQPVTLRTQALTYLSLVIVGAGILLTSWLWYRSRIPVPKGDENAPLQTNGAV